MRILCSSSVYEAEAAFGSLGEVMLVPEEDWTPDTLRGIDVIISRSKVAINETLLVKSSPFFYGSATAGIDHVDTRYLEQRQIHFAHAPGCNAEAVGEYVLLSLLQWEDKKNDCLEGKTIAIIGHGATGMAVEKRAQCLGMHVELCDPPKANEMGLDKRYVSLEDILPKADFVSLHVPLVKDGPYATRGLFNAHTLSLMKSGACLINTSRGEVVEPRALLASLYQGHLSEAIVDVWDRSFDQELIQQAFISTPHIAGKSLPGVAEGTRMIYDALCNMLDQNPLWQPRYPELFLSWPSTEKPTEGLRALTASMFNLHQVSETFKSRVGSGATVQARKTAFVQLRRQHQPRPGFRQGFIVGLKPNTPEGKLISRLGFRHFE